MCVDVSGFSQCLAHDDAACCVFHLTVEEGGVVFIVMMCLWMISSGSRASLSSAIGWRAIARES